MCQGKRKNQCECRVNQKQKGMRKTTATMRIRVIHPTLHHVIFLMPDRISNTQHIELSSNNSTDKPRMKAFAKERLTLCSATQFFKFLKIMYHLMNHLSSMYFVKLFPTSTECKTSTVGALAGLNCASALFSNHPSGYS